MQDLIQWHQDVPFNILPSLGGKLLFGRRATPSETPPTAPHRPEDLLEKIAESRPAKFELEFLPPGTSAARATASGATPIRRRTELGSRAPAGAELIVALSLSGIAQHFVGLVDFLEAFFGLLLVLGDIRMEFARELAERFLDLRFARGAGHSQNLVIVFVSNGHSNLPIGAA